MDFREIKEFFKDTSQYIIIFIVVLFSIIYIVSLQQVIGPSMVPTLNEGDVLILSKSHYRVFDFKRGDMVAFKYEGKHLVKRVIGLPGEIIEFKEGILYVNGKGLEETYTSDTYTEDFKINDLGFSQIPRDMYLLLGDNRLGSLDSRVIGLIDKKDITGKVIIRLWPLLKFRLYS